VLPLACRSLEFEIDQLDPPSRANLGKNVAAGAGMQGKGRAGVFGLRTIVKTTGRGAINPGKSGEGLRNHFCRFLEILWTGSGQSQETSFPCKVYRSPVMRDAIPPRLVGDDQLGRYFIAMRRRSGISAISPSFRARLAAGRD